MTYRFLTGEHLEFDLAVATLEGMHTPYCWGCGVEAEQGLGLRPELEGSMIRADLEFARRFEGGPGTVHGGAISLPLWMISLAMCPLHTVHQESLTNTRNASAPTVPATTFPDLEAA